MAFPAIAEQDGVAFHELEVGHALLLQRRLDVVHARAFALVHGFDAARAGEVEQDAARDDRMQLFDAELGQTRSRRKVRFDEAVVQPHVVAFAIGADLHADVAEAIELRPDLTDLGGHELVVPDDLVAAKRSTGRGAGYAHDELARAEQRHLRVVFVAQLVDLALVGLGERAQDHLGLGVPVGRAGLVTLPPQIVRPPFAADGCIHLVALDPRLAGAVLPVVLTAFGPGDSGAEHQRTGGGEQHA
jgi:hypothetical protein